jgi:predicted ArsR family transcriptional regulator
MSARRTALTREAVLRRVRDCAAAIQVWSYGREVARGLGVSPSTVSRHLHALAERGVVVIQHHGRRGLVLEVPGLGRTAEP